MSNLFSNEFISLCEANNIEPHTMRSSWNWFDSRFSVEGMRREELLREVESHLPGYASNPLYANYDPNDWDGDEEPWVVIRS